jgi:hypothetical protein
MSDERKQRTPTGVSVDHYFAGLAIWAAAMVVLVILL